MTPDQSPASRPNLFKFATKELSQDAMICWLVECAHSATDNLRQVGQAFLRELLRCNGGEEEQDRHGKSLDQGSEAEIEVLKLERQYGNKSDKIDVYVLVRAGGRKISIVIEDKTFTREHSDQLRRYKELVKGDQFEEDCLKLIYFKTGFLFSDERRAAKRAGYSIFDLDALCRFLRAEPAASEPNDLLAQFREHKIELQKWRCAKLDRWEVNEDFVQYRLMEEIGCRLRAKPDWQPSLPEEWGNDELLRGTSFGNPWSQYWFAKHLFWRLDGWRRELRLMAYVDPARLPAHLPTWRQGDVDDYRRLFEEATGATTGLAKEKSRTKRTATEQTVGALKLPLVADAYWAEEQDMDAFLERIPELQKNLIRRLAGFDEVCVAVHKASREWEEQEPPAVARSFGRRGFEVVGSQGSGTWRPGVFVGALFDGRDHGVQPLDGWDGDASVILDLHEMFRKTQLDDRNSAYWTLVADLARSQRRLPPNWELHHHWVDRNIRPDGAWGGKPNPWHPLHIRCPWSKIGGNDSEARSRTFLEETREVVEFLVERPAFRKLRAACAVPEAAGG